MLVITASQTADGAPVYLTKDRTWARELSHAHVIETDSERDELLGVAREQEAVVCDPYVFKVSVDGGAITPATTRERIRHAGPTISYLPKD